MHGARHLLNRAQRLRARPDVNSEANGSSVGLTYSEHVSSSVSERYGELGMEEFDFWVGWDPQALDSCEKALCDEPMLVNSQLCSFKECGLWIQ